MYICISGSVKYMHYSGSCSQQVIYFLKIVVCSSRCNRTSFNIGVESARYSRVLVLKEFVVSGIQCTLYVKLILAAFDKWTVEM